MLFASDILMACNENFYFPLAHHRINVNTDNIFRYYIIILIVKKHGAELLCVFEVFYLRKKSLHFDGNVAIFSSLYHLIITNYKIADMCWVYIHIYCFNSSIKPFRGTCRKRIFAVWLPLGYCFGIFRFSSIKLLFSEYKCNLIRNKMK